VLFVFPNKLMMMMMMMMMMTDEIEQIKSKSGLLT